jgi:hypothetical protein
LSVGFEEAFDIGFVDSPETFFEEPPFLSNKIFLLPGEIGDAILYFRPPL